MVDLFVVGSCAVRSGALVHMIPTSGGRRLISGKIVIYTSGSSRSRRRTGGAPSLRRRIFLAPVALLVASFVAAVLTALLVRTPVTTVVFVYTHRRLTGVVLIDRWFRWFVAVSGWRFTGLADGFVKWLSCFARERNWFACRVMIIIMGMAAWWRLMVVEIVIRV